MAYRAKVKSKAEIEELRKRDAHALACLLLDIWQEKQQKERNAKLTKEDSDDKS